MPVVAAERDRGSRGGQEAVGGAVEDVGFFQVGDVASAQKDDQARGGDAALEH
jgi:hypothetical protein